MIPHKHLKNKPSSQPTHSRPNAKLGGASNTPPYPQPDSLKPATCKAPAIFDYLANNYQKSQNKYSPIQDKSNRNIDIGIDYLMGVVKLPAQEFNNFIQYCSATFDSEFDFYENTRRHGCYSFTHEYYSPTNGFSLYVCFDDGLTIASINIPGKALRPLALNSILQFIIRAWAIYCCKFTRIDIRLDDYKKRVKFKTLHNLAEIGDIAGAQIYDRRSSGVVGDLGLSNSETVYFGSSKSKANLKVYNAEFLHSIPAYRWEGVFREYKAKTIVDFIVSTYEDFTDTQNSIQEICKYLGHKVLNITKFIKRKGDKKQSVSRFKQYRFYSSLLRDVGDFDYSLLKDLPTPKVNEYHFVLKTFDWFNRQVFKRFDMLRNVLGCSTFDIVLSKCLEASHERYTNQDNILSYKLSQFMQSIDPMYLPQFTMQLVPS